MGDTDQRLNLTFEKNRRKHKRHDVLLRVRLRDEELLRELYATDLSKGGLFVTSKSELQLDQKLEVALVHPLTEEVLHLECQVANERRDEDGALRGYGLRFVSFSEETKAELELFVEGVIELEPDEDLELLDETHTPPPVPVEAAQRSQARNLLLQGQRLLNEGNLITATHVISRATSIDPTDEAAWSALREIEARLKKGRRAEEELSIDVDLSELDEEVELEPADRRKAKLLYEAARDCHETEEVEDALLYLEKSLNADPTFQPALSAMAKLLIEVKGDAAAGAALCDRLLELDPEDETALALREAARR